MKIKNNSFFKKFVHKKLSLPKFQKNEQIFQCVLKIIYRSEIAVFHLNAQNSSLKKCGTRLREGFELKLK